MFVVQNAMTGLRLAIAPFLWVLIGRQQFGLALLLLSVAIALDATDGWVARRYGSPTTWGGYFDATADFTVIEAAFLAFAGLRLFPAWLPALIAIAFVVFLVTSRMGTSIYDPVGRYLGAILFVEAAVTLVLPNLLADLVLWSAAAALGATILARLIHVGMAWRERRGRLPAA